MKFKKLVQLMLVCSVVLNCVCMGVGAVEATERRATGKFSMDIAADTMVKANSSFPLEVGEVVTIVDTAYDTFPINGTSLQYKKNAKMYGFINNRTGGNLTYGELKVYDFNI